MPRSIPRWLPPILFAVLTLVLFRDFVFSREMLFGSDTEAMGYMARLFYAQELRAGNFPGWNPLLLGGTPFLASLAGGDSLYPPSVLLLLILEPYRALGWKLVLHVFFAGLGMYGFVRALGGSRAGATVAGTAYLVAPFLVTLVWPGHDGKLFVTALAPWLFWAIESWFRSGRGLAWAGIGAVVALVILTTHFQMAYFLFGAAGVYAIALAVGMARPRDEDGQGREPAGRAVAGRRFVLFLLASLTGLAGAGVQFLPAVDYITEYSRRTATTTRADPGENRVYASSWSLHPEEAAGLVIPEFVGSDTNGAEWTSGTYWGRNPFKLNHEYLGLAALLLALAAFLGGARRLERWTLFGIGAVAFLYALGTHTPVWGILYALLPGIELFRAPSMAIFLTGLAVCALAGLGVDRFLTWVEHPDEPGARRGQRTMWIATGVLGGLLVLAASGALFSAWSGILYPDLAAGKADALARAQPFIVRGALVATLLAGAVAGVLTLGRRGALPAAGLVAALVAIVALDGIRVSGAFVETRDFQRFSAPDPNIQALERLQTTEPPFRVLDMNQGGQSVRPAMFGIELASGHHPNDLARYRELTGMEGSGAPMNLLQSANVQKILNVRYLIWPVRTLGAPEGFEPVSATQLADGQLYEAVYEIPTLPRARLVAQAEVVPDDQAVERLMDPAFDVASTVTVPEPLQVELGGGVPVGEVEWILRDTDRSALRVEIDRPGLLVVANNFYPAWQATVDGASTPIFRVNHTLQGIPVEAGIHEVTLTFRSARVRQGLLLSGAGLLLLTGVAGTSVVRRRQGDPDA
ncbi:MAG: hypothetical protein P8188_05150, partial [Gemmatimonadota bacterium]